MNQNDFLLLNAGVVTLVVISLVVMRRKPPQPVKLQLHAKDSRVPAKPQQPQQPPPPGAPPPPPGAAKPGAAPQSQRSVEKALNVFFDFDGRSYDAFDVLQIPAGSSLASAQIAFNTLARVSKPESQALLQTAISAITNHAARP
jgi:hypothetical protein